MILSLEEDGEAAVSFRVIVTEIMKQQVYKANYKEPVQALFTDPVSIFVSTLITIGWRYLEEWRSLIIHTWTNDAVWLSILFSLGPQHLPKLRSLNEIFSICTLLPLADLLSTRLRHRNRRSNVWRVVVICLILASTFVYTPSFDYFFTVHVVTSPR